MSSIHICMAAFSDLRFDYRIFREATSLQRAGHRVSIVSSHFVDEALSGWQDFDLRLVPIDRSASLRRTYPSFWRQARKHLIELGGDVYHAHDLDALWPTSDAARRHRVPLIYDSHELWTEQSSLVNRPQIRFFWQALERWLIRRVDYTITVSSSIGKILQDTYGLERPVLLRNLPLFRPIESSDRIRTELDLPNDRPILLYQGGFLSENGLSEQIEAIEKVDAYLVLIGDGPMEAQLKEQVLCSNLQDKVFFIPRVPFRELHSYTCSADVGLCLIKGMGRSFYFSLPNKLFEYMMAGLPVLASNFPEMGAIVDQTGTGTLADPSNSISVRQGMNALLSDPDRLNSHRQAALKAAKQFNWERESSKLVELYAKL